MVKILIIDDVRAYLDSLSRALASEYNVLTAANLDDAKVLMNDTIILTLIDIRLSETEISNRDGIRFLEWLRHYYPGVPAIMMSAYSDYDAAVDSLNLGAVKYLKKPINLRELKAMINLLINEEE
ncbi:response regulator [candidate division KSB1 bacterium]|nr:response regulator [candidate division KSB1 bacterium]